MNTNKSAEVAPAQAGIAKVMWAGQLCDVIEETPSQIKVRYTNGAGTAEHWLSRSANLYTIQGEPRREPRRAPQPLGDKLNAAQLIDLLSEEELRDKAARLVKANGALLEALEECRPWVRRWSGASGLLAMVDNAIAQAKGEA